MSNYNEGNYRFTCDLLGRLGNNMFQTACCYGLAEKYGVQWGIPSNYHHRNIYNFFPRIPKLPFQPRWTKYEESCPNFGYRDIPYNGQGVILRGFWQSELYFTHIRDKIIELFNLRYCESNYISIHVRRGDYLEYSQNFTTIYPSYLNPAMEHFPNSTFLVFSDDINWCKENMPKDYPDKKFLFCDYGNEFDQLSLQASCRGNIIGASSFSWWGAWLNKNPNKVVIAPTKETWFGPNNTCDASDIVPKSWIQIPAR